VCDGGLRVSLYTDLCQALFYIEKEFYPSALFLGRSSQTITLNYEMLGEVMVAQDLTVIAHGDDLLSIREMPGDTTGKSTLSMCIALLVLCRVFSDTLSISYLYQPCRRRRT
jgi:hypothetical protein